MKLPIASVLYAGSAAAFAPSAFLLGGSSNQHHHQQQLSIGIPTATQLDAIARRRPFISGNWKLNPQTKDEAMTLAKDIADSIPSSLSENADVALFVPYVFIESAMGVVGDKLSVGAEAVVPQTSGAFTGAISVPMLQSIGVQWTLAGHSERRTIFGESDEYINEQCLQVINETHDMCVMLCIGESLDEFELDLAGSICELQLKKGLRGIKKEDLGRVAIAYEPVWAIGTGKVATPEIAQSVHATCRAILADMYDHEAADGIRILYGGSVTPESVNDLMSMPDIDGALVGGASLDAEKFARIINFKEAAVLV